MIDFGISIATTLTAAAIAKDARPGRVIRVDDPKDVSFIDCWATPAPPRLRLNCRNCGAPHEPVECSYCRSPSP